MTVTTDTRKAGPYIGNGVASAFSFAFKVFASSDLVVSHDANDVETELTLNDGTGSGYTVSLNADQNTNPGGTVTYTVNGVVTALPVGQSLTITSDVPETQEVDLVPGGPFLPQVIEDALDKLTILYQQIKVGVGRALKQPLADEDPIANLPSAASRASKFLAFDAGGDPIASSGTGADAGLRADLASTGVSLGASLVGVRDVAGLIAGTTVETALAQLARASLGFATEALLEALDHTTLADGQIVTRYGYWSVGDGLMRYRWSAGSSVVHNGGTVVKPTSVGGGNGRLLALDVDHGVFAEAFGAKGDNAQNDAPFLQSLIDWAISTGKPALVSPFKTYKIDSPLIAVSRPGGVYAQMALELRGESYACASGNVGFAARIRCTFSDTFGIGIQLARAVKLKNLHFTGTNSYSINPATYAELNGTKASFVTGTCRDSRYSPYSGIVIDPFGTALPPDGGYPGLGAYYHASAGGSSDIEVENVKCTGFVCGAIITPNNTTANAEGITFAKTIMETCTVGFAIGQSQSRNVNLLDYSYYGGHVAVDTNSYGLQNGSAPKIVNANLGGCTYLFKNNGGAGQPLSASGIHAESFLSIGWVGPGASTGNVSSRFSDSLFSFAAVSGVDELSTHLILFGPTLFENCTFAFPGGTPTKRLLRMYQGASTQGQAGLCFDNCTFTGSNDARDPYQFFAGGPYIGQELHDMRFRNCRLASINGTVQKILDDYYKVASLSNLNSLGIVPGSRIRSAANSLNSYSPKNALGAHALGAVTITKLNNNTATFVAADAAVLQLGDIIYDQDSFLVEDAAGTVTQSARLPLGYVTNIAGTTITVGSVPRNHPGGARTLHTVWMPKFHTATVGDTTNTSAVLTNVANTAAWTVGDRIIGAGIPSGSYVTAISAGVSLTISKAATATAAAVRLYDADVSVFTGVAL